MSNINDPETVCLHCLARDRSIRGLSYDLKALREAAEQHARELDYKLKAAEEKLAVAIDGLRSFALHWNAWRRPQDMAKAAQLVLNRVEKIRKIAECVKKHERPEAELWIATHWCNECGFPVDDHAAFRERGTKT